jgi:hypothetical protein
MPQAISKAPLAPSLAVALALIGSLAPVARADEVTDWNQQMVRTHLAAGAAGGVIIRGAAIVEAAVFDAVNGIEQRYTSLHVAPAAPAGASARAAAVQAAYAALLQLYPTQKPALDARRFASLADLADREDPAAIASGIAWGQTVATAILAWRSTDGTNAVLPPFIGGTNPGEWRPTPPGFLPMRDLAFATATPWILTSASQFRPGPPPALTSDRYTADFNEVKLLGSANSTARTAEQTIAAYFWQSSTSPVYLWNTLAQSLLSRGRGNEHESPSHARHALVDHARLFALLNIALADAFIAVWDSKLTYDFWRPITAINLASTDGNPATIEDPTWVPLLVTPNYPDYVSGQNGVSAAGATVLRAEFGNHTRITMRADLVLGVTRSFNSFSAVLDEIVDARVYEGIHFRFADEEARTLGITVANYVLEHVAVRQ